MQSKGVGSEWRDEYSGWRWVRWPDAVALFLFSCGMMFLHGRGQQQALGGLLCVSLLICHLGRLNAALRQLLPVPPEIKAYTLWVVWSGITGVFVSANAGLFGHGLRVIVQMLVLVWAVYSVTRLRPGAINAVFAGIILGGIIQICAVLGGVESIHSQLQAEDRAYGLTVNPNALAFKMLWTVLIALMLWMRPVTGEIARKGLRKGLIAVLVSVAGYVVIVSGSRKSLLAMAFVLVLWGLCASSVRRSIWAGARRVTTTGLIAVMIAFLLPFVLEETIVGIRLQAFLDQGSTITESLESNTRLDMYVEGLRMFIAHPIFGVGLNNFRFHFWTGQYSHSDYIEALATTGIVGFVLYHSVYVFVLFRALRLQRAMDDITTRYRLRMVAITIATIMLIGLGAPHYASQDVFVMVAAFSVYTMRIQEALVCSKRTAYGRMIVIGSTDPTRT